MYNVFKTMVESTHIHAKLREQVLSDQEAEVNNRLQNNPQFTEEEKNLGVYTEEIEPQVRNAVFDLNRKGYSTYYSGFYDLDSRYQVIEGRFRLDNEIANQLNTEGVEVMIGQAEEFGCTPLSEDEEYITIIQFKANTIDLKEIEAKWNTIVAMIPARL